EDRYAAAADEAQLAVAVHALEHELGEGLVGSELGPVRVPLPAVGDGHFAMVPARRADVALDTHARRLVRAAAQHGEAELLVLLPVPVGGNLEQRGQALTRLCRSGRRIAGLDPRREHARLRAHAPSLVLCAATLTMWGSCGSW